MRNCRKDAVFVEISRYFELKDGVLLGDVMENYDNCWFLIPKELKGFGVKYVLGSRAVN